MAAYELGSDKKTVRAAQILWNKAEYHATKGEADKAEEFLAWGFNHPNRPLRAEFRNMLAEPQ